MVTWRSLILRTTPHLYVPFDDSTNIDVIIIIWYTYSMLYKMMSYPFFIIDMDIPGQIIIFIHISLTWLILPFGDDSPFGGFLSHGGAPVVMGFNTKSWSWRLDDLGHPYDTTETPFLRRHHKTDIQISIRFSETTWNHQVIGGIIIQLWDWDFPWSKPTSYPLMEDHNFYWDTSL